MARVYDGFGIAYILNAKHDKADQSKVSTVTELGKEVKLCNTLDTKLA